MKAVKLSLYTFLPVFLLRQASPSWPMRIRTALSHEQTLSQVTTYMIKHCSSKLYPSLSQTSYFKITQMNHVLTLPPHLAIVTSICKDFQTVFQTVFSWRSISHASSVRSLRSLHHRSDTHSLHSITLRMMRDGRLRDTPNLDDHADARTESATGVSWNLDIVFVKKYRGWRHCRNREALVAGIGAYHYTTSSMSHATLFSPRLRYVRKSGHYLRRIPQV